MKSVKIKSILRSVLMLLMIGYIIGFFATNIEALQLFREIRFLYIGLILAAYLSAFMLMALRYRIVLNKCSGQFIPFYEWLKIYALGNALNRIMPQAGNIYKGYTLKDRQQIAFSSYISSYLSFSWMDLLINSSIAIIITALVDPRLKLSGISLILILTLIFIVVALVPLLLYYCLAIFNVKNQYISWANLKARQAIQTTLQNVRDIKYLTLIVLTGILAFINSALIFYFAFGSIEITIDLPIIAMFVIILKLSHMVIVTPGNLGARELAYGIVGQLAGIGMAQALVVAVITRIIATAVIFILAVSLNLPQLLVDRKRKSLA